MTIQQKKAKVEVDQVTYNGRLVDRAHFRAYVYNFDGEKLANSYEEYEELLASGDWFNEKCKVLKSHEAPKVPHTSNVEPKEEVKMPEFKQSERKKV